MKSASMLKAAFSKPTAALILAAGLALSSAGIATAAPVETGTSQLANASANASCTVPAKENLAIAKQIYKITQQRKATARVLLATFEAAWVESHVNNLNCGDSDSLGVFQQRPSQGWGTKAQVTNVDYATNKFLDQAIKNDKGFSGTAGQLAQSVQRSGYPDRYDQAKAKAESIIAEAKK